MIQDRLAVIDVGTNTFHLLIAQLAKGKIQILYKDQKYVKLGADGIQSLSRPAMDRGILAFQEFRQVLDHYKVKECLAFGTEALRKASNGHEFVTEVHHTVDLDIQVISGDEEARLIQKGILSEVPKTFTQNAYILDIGGGSVENIIRTEGGSPLRKSLPIGVAVLTAKITSDPLSQTDLRELINLISKYYHPFWSNIPQQAYNLVGASGSFEVLQKFFPNAAQVNIDRFIPLLTRIIYSSRSERQLIPEIPPQRIDYIVSACVLIQYIITQLHIKQLYLATHAMKEGILLEWFERLYPEKKIRYA